MYVAGDIFAMELTGGTVPASGTVWSLRQYTGAITAVTGRAALRGPTPSAARWRCVRSRPWATDCGCQLRRANNSRSLTLEQPDLKKVHTVPDPYYVTSEYEADHGHQDHQVREPARQGHDPDLLVERVW